MIWIVLMLLVLAVPLAIAAGKPSTLRVERSARIPAPPESIYSRLDNFRAWAEWSPWERLDPGMSRAYSGPDRGPGAAYAWSGRKAGAGRMEIEEAAPPDRLTMRLAFERPYRSVNTVRFTLRRDGDATEVTWAMEGPQPFVSRLAGIFLNLDRMIGRDFETGLANLKSLSERQPAG